MRRCVLSCVRRFVTPWTGAWLICLWDFSRQEYWSGLPFLPPGDLPNQESNPRLLHLLYWQVGSLPLTPPGNQLYFNKEKRLSSINHLYSISGSWGFESWCYTPKSILIVFFFNFFYFPRDKTQSPDDWLFHISLITAAPDRLFLEVERSNHEKVEVLIIQSCPTLCNPMDCSLPGSSVPEISKASMLEQVVLLHL